MRAENGHTAILTAAVNRFSPPRDARAQERGSTGRRILGTGAGRRTRAALEPGAGASAHPPAGERNHFAPPIADPEE
ncbi:hypothetical protein Sgou_07600 [Streptomyces gougerotii]|uniref:Uncharacterized protein n=2 Tax=Streptomyces diastaticus group TaxID=2849069 RepID=A0A8H9HSZ7_9ACTN|nr:hypothetical protein Srut_29480 [Streptomyces rutgersensis]GFH71723.1 hypothetical protein Sdia_24910 [Streptomyces diastaticus subsp. diastaticus]GFH76090.1 hypothetical protein Sgou_07600 [Streptomyces gougerotii]GGU14227.1 hypothetical protein GCM10015534_16460 [Streptomyces diastaticus subsp. diastaticus]GGU86286.1 hypothetical protein GCM10010227_45930 [Streptomyces gougerotii]